MIRPNGSPSDQVRSAALADVVQIGKFDVDRHVRLRAFYEPAGVSIRFQAGGPHNGVERTLSAFRHVHRYAPGLMPQVFDDGRLRTARYLVEESLFGTHPRSGRPLQGLAEEVGSGLRLLHDGYGTTDQQLSTVLGEKFPQRWREAVAAHDLTGDLDRLVRDLVGQDRLVEVSYGHGDLVGSNIMQLRERVVLIDWEYSGKTPIAFDVAKIHLHCADPAEAAQLLRKGLHRPARAGASHYSFTEQIALAHVRYIAWSGTSKVRAESAGRVQQFRNLIRKRAGAVEQLLEMG
ncbi:phosphotransferase [Pseudactinotalea sp. Z1748]|uniref:phosphotransferase n=1 Tax=Pseudactinotalea sp. Z1748 TaxID=3413027 RepID=UPI003C7E8C9C